MDTLQDRIAFVQISNFSDTNSSIEKFIPKYLDGRRLDAICLWPIIKKNLFLLGICLMSGVWRHGLSSLRSTGAMHAAAIKTPVFFRLASRLARREIDRGGPTAAVLMTQGLLDPSSADAPLVIYTDDCMLNPANRLFPIETAHPDHVALERRLFANATRIAVGGSHVARALDAQYGLRPPEVVVVGMGANVARPDDDAVDERPERWAAGRILFVGLDWERKGGPTLVEAFRRLLPRHQHARLTIVGATPDLSHPAIEVIGRVPPDRVAEAMRTASIFCMPSLLEPFGIATVEAAHYALPAVATTIGGFPDTVVDGETGLLVPPGDVDALEAALDRLLSDPERARAMGLNARRWAVDRFTWDAVCRRLAGVIEDAIAEGSPPAPATVARPT